MKKIALLFVAFISMMSVSFAQAKKVSNPKAPATKVATAPEWPAMKTFHSIMAATFHPAEEGNFTPIREKASDLYSASKEFYASEIPAQYNAKETSETLEKLMIKCNELMGAVVNKENDEVLKKLITEAHDFFHHIAGECKKAGK